MNFLIIFSVVFALIKFSEVSSQTVFVNCNYVIISSFYTRFHKQQLPVTKTQTLSLAEIINPEEAMLMFCEFKFYFQTFTTFTNVEHFTMHFSRGFTTIQANAFANAQSVRTILITSNSDLKSIGANAFSRATNLQELRLHFNEIETN